MTKPMSNFLLWLRDFLIAQVVVLAIALLIVQLQGDRSIEDYGQVLTYAGAAVFIIGIILLRNAVKGFHFRSQRSWANFYEHKLFLLTTAVGIVSIIIGQLLKVF